MVRASSKPAVGGPERARWRHTGHTPRRNAGLAQYENVLSRAGLAPVAGVDEAGRGACAGPLVIAAVVLDNAKIRRMPGLADSKLLTPEEREDAYAEVMRWALFGLGQRPGYVLTDGFPVRGLGTPALAVWKGDRVTASVAAASIVAKVTRDRMMLELDERYPQYGFCRHKGDVSGEHLRTLAEFAPCPEHRTD